MSYSIVHLYSRKRIAENAQLKSKWERYYTNQKANSAANLFAIHFSHLHAIPKAENNESQKECCLSS